MKLQTPPFLALAVTMIASFPAAGCTVYTTPPAQTEMAYAETPPPPPAPLVEVIPVTPGPEYVWVPGRHEWNGHRYVWIGGRYDRDPRRDARYVRGHWEHRGRVTVWVDGHPA
jgi:hypothetical protein